MIENTKLLDLLVKALRGAAAFDENVLVAPACVLWPDGDRQWEGSIELLQAKLPELLVLGDYEPLKRTGPAIWLRCVIAGNMPDVLEAGGQTPVLYLPGVSCEDLRPTESCHEFIKPLVELQYRGVLWSRENSKDWTIPAFLKSTKCGLGLDVPDDPALIRLLASALPQFLDEEVALLKGKRLDKDYLDTLIVGDDWIGNLLKWINDPIEFESRNKDKKWISFCNLCASKLKFFPQSEGIFSGAEKLANHSDKWKYVWDRYIEVPKNYPNIEGQIRNCAPSDDDPFWQQSGGNFEGWPPWNDLQENELRNELARLSAAPPHKARKAIVDLEAKHCGRRSMVWGAKLEESPLALALEHLAILAETTGKSLAVGSAQEKAAEYSDWGWRADDAAVRAWASAGEPSDIEALTAAIRSVYLPWADESARHLQKVLESTTYPGASGQAPETDHYTEGDCVLFVDGLRFDAGRRLLDNLAEKGIKASLETVWAALPTVTATGKPSVSPVWDQFGGNSSSVDFEPAIARTQKTLKGGRQLKTLIEKAGWSVLGDAKGDGRGKAWCEFGQLDEEGHLNARNLAEHLEEQIQKIGWRISDLLDAGWRRIVVVTDHGWLLMPGGLPKIELAYCLTESKWGRYAVLKEGASTKDRIFSWRWNPGRLFAAADGVSCYKSGQEFAHGGLSLQECLTPRLIVTSEGRRPVGPARLAQVKWRQLRCFVYVEGGCPSYTVDLRTRPGEEDSSLVEKVNPLNEDGTASVTMKDSDKVGESATVVLLDENNGVVAQAATVVGGGDV